MATRGKPSSTSVVATRAPDPSRPLPADGRQRVALERPTPQVDGGRFPVKRVVGDSVDVEVDAFTAGHDQVAGVVRWRHSDAAEWREAPLHGPDNDRWRASFTLDRLGTSHYAFAAWIDRFGTWRHDLVRRLDASQDVTVDLAIGAEIVRSAASRAPGDAASRLRTFATTLESGGDAGTAAALSPELLALASAHPDREHESVLDHGLRVDVDVERARFSTWYERFPRSCGPDAASHGTFDSLRAELPRVARMGFDVLYLPPIHPIGREHRKGRNNAVVAAPGDHGSPWAIGAAEGGHTAIHPDLGDLDSFSQLVAEAGALGIDVALDLAYQCAPDHPWVAEHPGWFRHRPDGSVQYAENPPKKYQDIYPLDFDTDKWEELWRGLKDVVDFWTARGIRIFRVDNPHTKAFPFWEWLIAEVRRELPDVIFLAEAFTRPKVMHRLAKLGFAQSYTYYAWRPDTGSIREYFTELAHTDVGQFFRPNVWPNTPDILTEQLQTGGRSTFVTRFVLAATLAASYGIYGPAYELMEHAPQRPGSEEYLDSEKYEIRWRDLSAADDFVEVIRRVNRARHDHPALQRNDTLHFLPTDNPMLLAYAKSLPDGSDTVLVVVNTDPDWRQAGFVDVPLADFGLDPTRPFQVHDLIADVDYLWQGARNYVELDPASIPAHVFHVTQE